MRGRISMNEMGYGLGIKEYDDKIRVSIDGYMDSTNYESVMAEFDNVRTDKPLHLDLENLEYMSSAGIRVLIALAKTYDEDFCVENVGPVVMEILESAGVTNIIPVYATTKMVETGKMNTNTKKDSFRRYLKENGNAPFIYWEDEPYTYTDVEKISQIIAADLCEQGVKRQSHVAICASDSLNLIASLFAVQKLGAVAAMINPSLTVEETVTLANEGDITHVIYERDDLKEAFADRNVYYIGKDVDYRKRFFEYEVIANRFTEDYDPDEPCVMIFTSGSTGIPKAALHSFYSLKLGANSIAKALGMVKGDKVCHTTLPFFHIGGLLLDLYPIALVGATLYFPQMEPGSNIVKRMSCILNAVEKYGCTILSAIPTTLYSICGLEEFSKEKIKTVRAGAMGSMPITQPQMKLLRDNYGHMKQAVLYGMTELLPATIVSSDDTWEHLVFTVGKPVDGVDVKIVSPSGDVCATGEAGEICMKADQAMACYYKMDVEKQPLDNSGYIRSGDLGFLDADGYLHLTGRIKDIIIRGGENIVPGEIEEAIASFEDVAYVYVCGVPDEMMGEKVASAIVMKNGCTLDAASMKNNLLSKIAKHKIPSYFLELDSFPLLPNGKTDKVKIKQKLVEFSKTR